MFQRLGRSGDIGLKTFFAQNHRTGPSPRFGAATRSRIALIATVAATLSLTGCAGIDGVELNGRVFDMLGVSSKNNNGGAPPKLKQRAGLVVPPSGTGGLPQPGQTPAQPQIAGAAWPVSAEDRLKSKDAQRKAVIARYCRDREWLERTKRAEFNEVTRDGTLCSFISTNILNKTVDNSRTKTGNDNPVANSRR
ncbi:MAG: hypothetical protein AAFR04_04580 [Pseudomonadota bacterium]